MTKKGYKLTAKADEAEAEAIKNTMKISKLLARKPEELGLKKGHDGAYHVTYQAHRIATMMSLTMLKIGLSKKRQFPV
ncbi:MAG: hypothetical protein ABSG73_00340 [Candidatus Aminicenantales bacterium]|jgi:hypothetical protein